MRVLIVLLVAIAAVVAVPRNPQRIIGGDVTTIERYPEMVAMLISYLDFTQICGGTIINNRAILTAAHCVWGDPPSRWRMRVGSTLSNSGGVVLFTAAIINHPNFSMNNLDNKDFDISIMHTTTSISFTNVIQPGRIAGANYFLADNQEVWAAGWGLTNPSGSQLSEQLRHVQVWTINQALCTSRYAAINLIVTDNMVCSGWLDVGGRDQCAGDSGGPLFHNGVVVGITGWGHGCASAHFPGVNTRVSRFTGWIQANA